MNKVFSLAAMVVGFLCAHASAMAIEIPEENVHQLILPDTFVIKGLYKSDYSCVFRDEDLIFAVGRFNKKFSLKSPYGKTITTARLYELIPDNHPLLVIRDAEGYILGYVHVEKNRPMQLFKATTSHVYDRNGMPILRVAFPLASKYCKIYSVEEEDILLLATQKGSEDDLVVKHYPSRQLSCINPLLLATVLQIHASKHLLTTLTNYTAVDEIRLEELQAFTQATDGQIFIKEVCLNQLPKADNREIDSLKEALGATYRPACIPEERRLEIANALSRLFGEDDISLATLARVLPLLDEDEKSVLLEMVEGLERD